jgi:hypothetical protein
LAASIVANFDELFWITDLSNDAEKMFEENGDSDVVTTVTMTGLLDNTMGDVIGDEDTANTSIEDEDMNDDDVGADHVEHIPAEIVDEADDDLLGVVTMHDNDKNDDTHELNVVDLGVIADHVLVCTTGTAGLSPDCQDSRSRDTATDEAEADNISDSLFDSLVITLGQKAPRNKINQILTKEPDRDELCAALVHLTALMRPLGAKDRVILAIWTWHQALAWG